MSDNIRSVIIRDNVTTIGNYAFGVCFYLTSVTIPNTVTSIKQRTFYSCHSLTSITIPNSMEKIEAGSFAYCGSLYSIQVDVQNVVYSSDNGVLYNKNKTILHTYPVGKKDEAFTIPSFVTTIGNSAFSNCELKFVTIPKSVISLEEDAFFPSFSLTDVTVEWAIPLSLSVYGSAFKNVSPQSENPVRTLHVPVGTIHLYRNEAFWPHYFSRIVEYNPTNTEHIEAPTLNTYASNGVLTISGLQLGKPISVYSISGQLVFRGVAKAETEQIPLNTNGIYLVTAGNQTISNYSGRFIQS